MEHDALATALGRWADGLAPAARDQLSTWDVRALYDRLSRAGDDVLGAFDGWCEELGPATRAALSRYDREALATQLTATRSPPRTSIRPERCPSCGSAAMVRTGSCLTCQECGGTTGCG